MSSRNFTRPRPTRRQNAAAPFANLLSRRSLLRSGAALGAGALLPVPASLAAEAPSSLTFPELARVTDAADHWPVGYARQVLIRWGDPLRPGAPAFAPAALTATDQGQQFGYNADLTVYLPLPSGSQNSDHGLLVVSHEYATPYLMFAGLTADDYRDRLTAEQVAVLKAAVGLSVLEVRKVGDRWEVVDEAGLNRRVTLDTPIRLSGPCAGHARMRTSADPDGRTGLGTMPNCNGGVTPWGTVLSGEEGAMDYFAGDYRSLPEPEVVERQGWDEDENDEYGLGKVEARFRFEAEPNEWNRFDWVVELDPFDPAAMPVKRTALGRFTHEGAQCVTAPDGRVVVLMGDDDDFEYLYRFVTARPWNPDDRAANRDLLDEGTLAVARFGEDGSLFWLPLVWGQGPLTAENDFVDQADVLFKTRLAADALGATPMDAPEGFIANPVTGSVYVALTENEDRLPQGEGDVAEQINGAGARAAPRRRRGRLGGRALGLGRVLPLRRPDQARAAGALPPGDLVRRLVHRPGQSRLRPERPPLGLHRRSAGRWLQRRPLCRRYGRARPGPPQAVQHPGGRGGVLLAMVHPRRAYLVPRGSASRRGQARR